MNEADAGRGLLSWLGVSDVRHITLHDDFLRDKESHLKGMFAPPLSGYMKNIRGGDISSLRCA